MNPKKKQELHKNAGDRFESFDDVEEDEVLWDDDAPGDPTERPNHKAKARGRTKASRSGPKKRSFDDDSDG